MIFFAISSGSQVVELIEKRIKDGDEILLRVCIIMFMAKLTIDKNFVKKNFTIRPNNKK